ncbi:hypothetical protein LCFBJUUZ_CDS0210 [Staphylococcus phage PG-2021_76]|uniref:Uncharacterized protein n=2 Tax=Viruses TaxID=10239 RepID=A0AB39C846_9CAUD|nr:hypothetical protein [Staphylococcus phage ZCSS1]
MPQEYRDPYSKAKLFIPTQQEKTISQMEEDLKDKLSQVDEIIARLNKAEKGNK